MAEEKMGFLDKLSMTAGRIGSQIHLRSLRDAFATLVPLYILGGFAVLINNILFPLFLKGASLEAAQVWGNVLVNGTLSIAGLMVAPVIAYCLSTNKEFKNPISAAVMALSALIVMMPMIVSVSPAGATDTTALVKVAGALSYKNLGTGAMFAGIIIGLVATELFMKISSNPKLQVNLGDNVPPAVGASFNVLIPMMIVLSLFAAISAILAGFGTDLINLIGTMIQAPLRNINTSLGGTVFLMSLGNLFFTVGIHQSVVTGALLDPLMLANINDNMLAYANHQPIPYIMNTSFYNIYGLMGGSGCTICLLIATFIFGRSKVTKNITALSTAPGLFNINEPVIFGYPIVFNLPLMIPFVLTPALSITIAYLATAAGFMNKCVVMIPWTTPPLIGPFLATAGDFRAVIVQLVCMAMGVALYLPFMKVSERVAKNMEDELEDEEDEASNTLSEVASEPGEAPVLPEASPSALDTAAPADKETTATSTAAL